MTRRSGGRDQRKERVEWGEGGEQRGYLEGGDVGGVYSTRLIYSVVLYKNLVLGR